MNEKQSIVLSIFTLVLGIIGLLSSCIFIGIIPCVIALILGIIAITKKQSKGMAIVGVICSAVGVMFFLFMMIAVLFSPNDNSVAESETMQTTVNGTEYVKPETSSEIATDWATEYTPINDFRYTVDGNTITLVRYEGEDTQILLSPIYTLDGTDYTLISMGDDACFLSETYITSVIIPEGVEEIGDSCFNSCSSLERIYLPSTLKEIPNTFFGYLGEYKVYCNSEISLPSERDKNDYELLIDNATQSEELGEGFARALNGMLGDVNSSGEDTDQEVEIYFGGSDEQWTDLTEF